MTIDYDRGPNDLEAKIYKLELDLKDCNKKVKQLEDSNKILENNLEKIKELHNTKILKGKK